MEKEDLTDLIREGRGGGRVARDGSKKKSSDEKRCELGEDLGVRKGRWHLFISPGLPGGPWGRALVRLVNSLTWLPSSKGQMSTPFHLRSCRSQKPFCSDLEWGFSTMHIHRAPKDTHIQRYYTHPLSCRQTGLPSTVKYQRLNTQQQAISTFQKRGMR